MVDNGERGGGDPAAESPDKERILKVRISGKCLGDLPRGGTILQLGNLDTVTRTCLGDHHDKIGTGKARTPACTLRDGNCYSPVHFRIELGRRTSWIGPKPQGYFAFRSSAVNPRSRSCPSSLAPVRTHRSLSGVGTLISASVSTQRSTLVTRLVFMCSRSLNYIYDDSRYDVA